MDRAPASAPLMILALWLAGLGAAGQFAKISVAFPALQALYPQAGASLGLLLSLISLVGLIFGLVAGMIVARLGMRRMLLIGLVLGALLSGLQALLPALPIFLASRVIEGVSHLVIVVAAPTLISELAPPRWRPAALTLWGTFFGVAFAVAAFAGLPLIDAYGAGALFAAHGVWMAAMAALLWAMLPRVPIVTGAAALNLADILRRHVTIYRSARIGAAAWGWMFYTLTFVSLLTLLPLVLPAGPPWMLSALPLTSIAVALTLVVALLRVMTAVQATVLGFGLSALAVAAIWSMPGALWPFFALFTALALVQSASFAVVPQLNARAEDRALANGAMAQMGNLGNLSGTPILLMIIGGLGVSAGLGFVLAVYLLGMVVHLALAVARRRQPA